MAAIRLSLVFRSESDSVAIQREHGNWAEPACRPGAFEFKAAATAVKVEFRTACELSPETVESLRQATERACTRIFGKELEARVARSERTRRRVAYGSTSPIPSSTPDPVRVPTRDNT
jgi:hypothetical protein